MKLISWNVNGLRSVYNKGFLEFLKKEKPDLLCLQETKIGKDQISVTPETPLGYLPFFSGANKKGYSGVATYVKDSVTHREQNISFGLGKKEFDNEGRFVISDHKDFTLYNIYYPSGTSGEERQNFKYKFLDTLYDHLTSLPKAKLEKLIICGDYNICHKEIDIHHPDKAEKLELSGFLPDERLWMDKFADLGFTDSFRHINGEIKDKYSWWSYRAGSRGKNLGWRIDYFFVGSKLKKRIRDAKILDHVSGSDHCPVVVEIE